MLSTGRSTYGTVDWAKFGDSENCGAAHRKLSPATNTSLQLASTTKRCESRGWGDFSSSCFCPGKNYWIVIHVQCRSLTTASCVFHLRVASLCATAEYCDRAVFWKGKPPSCIRITVTTSNYCTANGRRQSDNPLSLWTGWVTLANEQLQRQTGITQLVLVLPSQTPSGNVWGGNGECKGREPIKAPLAGHAKEPPSSSPSILALCFGAKSVAVSIPKRLHPQPLFATGVRCRC